jgi:L-histidine Nalpha-methyltransferase
MLDHPNDGPLRLARVDPAFRHDVPKGLGVRPRAIPARWLYDRNGSTLFEVPRE